jgi:hypothetical protein
VTAAAAAAVEIRGRGKRGESGYQNSGRVGWGNQSINQSINNIYTQTQTQKEIHKKTYREKYI